MSGALAGFLVLVIVLPLLLNEVSDLATWLAGRLLRWGARRLGSAAATDRYSEEWLAMLELVPGKLTRLAWACGILLWSVPALRWRAHQLKRASGVSGAGTGWQPTRLPRDLSLPPTRRVHSNRTLYPERIEALEQAWESVQSTVQAAGERLGVPYTGRWNRGQTEYGLVDWRVRKLLRITGDRRWKVIARNITELDHVRDQYERQLMSGANGRPGQIHWRPAAELTEGHLTAYRAAARQVCAEMAMLSGARTEDQARDNPPS